MFFFFFFIINNNIYLVSQFVVVVGGGVDVTVVCSTDSRDAEQLKSRNNLTASRSLSPLSSVSPLLYLSLTIIIPPLSLLFLVSLSITSLLLAHCTVPL